MNNKGLLRATLTLLAGGALAQALPLLLGPWLTRLFTPAEYGQFGFIWTLASNVAVVGCARYEFALPMERDDAQATALLALCARVLAVVTLASALMALVLAAWRHEQLLMLLPLAVLGSASAQALTLWATRAQAFKRLALARFVQWGGAALLQLAGGLLGLGVSGLLLGPVAACLLAAVLMASPAPQGGWTGLLRLPRSAWLPLARRHRDFPWLNTPQAFLGALQDSLALILIAAYAGNAAAGFWVLSLRYLKAPATLVGGALSQALYPQLAQAANAAEAAALVRKITLLLIAVALPIMPVLFFGGPWLFARLFGADWRPAGELARALAPYIAAHFVAAPLSVVTLAWRQQGWALRLSLVGQLLFVLGLGLGLRLGGLIGAGWGVSVTMVLYFGWFFWALPRKATGGLA